MLLFLISLICFHTDEVEHIIIKDRFLLLRPPIMGITDYLCVEIHF